MQGELETAVYRMRKSNLHIIHAERWHQRLLGLMFRRALAPDQGMLLSPCASVHTAFMRFAIDVVYMDAHWRVLRIDASLPPWRASWGPKGTRHTLELASGSARDLGFCVGESWSPLTTERSK